MANPIDKLKKLKGRTWTEIRARGGQVFSAYTEQIGLSGKLPTDEEFGRSIDNSAFDGIGITKDTLFIKFFEFSEKNFFPSFRDLEKISEFFDEESSENLLKKAENLIEGKFDLLGYENLDFGQNVDWHYEPLAKKHIPLKHWKQFDEFETSETGDKKIVWELNRHQHFFTLGAAYRLTKDEKFARTFADHLSGWMEQNPPGLGINWFSSLEVAFRAMSWIWAFNFFKDSESFTPELFQQALKFLQIHGRHLEKYLSTYYSPNTHLTGEALGLYYLGTQLPFFSRAGHWRKLGSDILFAELDRQILPDGVYFEQSTWYQRYTIDFYIQFLILKTLDGEDTAPELQAKFFTKLRQMLEFMMYLMRPDGTLPIIGDDDGGQCLPLDYSNSGNFGGFLSTGAVLFMQADLKFAAGKFAAQTFWLLGTDAQTDFENLQPAQPAKQSAGFADGGYFVMRDGWNESDNYLLIDGGNMGALSGGHSHADALAIDLAVGGKSFLVDSGTYTYHESKELRDYFRSTAAHNTLTINNESSSVEGGKFNWRTTAQTKVNSWISEPRFDFFEGSHDGYTRLANSAAHTRSILFLKNDYWIMRDYVETSGAYDYQLNFHFSGKTNPEIVKSGSGKFCVDETSDAENGLRIAAFGDNGGWRREQNWVSDCYGKRQASAFLQFVSKGIGSQEFFTFLMPLEKLFAAPETFEIEITGGRAFVVKHRNYNDLFIFGDGSQTIRTEFFDTNFRFSWARLSAGETLPEEFVMVDGKSFVMSGREIVNYPSGLKFAAARRLGNRLNVHTNQSIFSVSLPQKRSHSYVLKNSV